MAKKKGKEEKTIIFKMRLTEETKEDVKDVLKRIARDTREAKEKEKKEREARKLSTRIKKRFKNLRRRK